MSSTFFGFFSPSPARAQRHGSTLNIEQIANLAPLIEEAARREAELVVVGETLTYAGVGSSYANCAESIPSPLTDYFGELAKKQELYIVAGLIESDWRELFNRIMSRPRLWA